MAWNRHAIAQTHLRKHVASSVGPKSDSTQVVTEPTPALYVKGCWPGSFVLQNFLSVSLTTPVACTVMVSPLAIVGEPSGAGVTVIFLVLRPLMVFPGAGARAQRHQEAPTSQHCHDCYCSSTGPILLAKVSAAVAQ